MIYSTIAIAPVIVILTYLYYRDKYNKEPIWLLLFLLCAGMFSVLPVLGMGGVTDYVGHRFGVKGLYKAGFRAFIQAGFVEEFFKFLFVFFIVWWNRHFDEKFDGIIYAVYVSMGFALVENILYVSSYGIETGLWRIITAVPAHGIFGISMGYYLGHAKFSTKLKPLYLALAFIVPWLLHGFYDFVLMADIPWLLIVFVVYLIFMYIYGFRRIRDFSKLKVKPIEELDENVHCNIDATVGQEQINGNVNSNSEKGFNMEQNNTNQQSNQGFESQSQNQQGFDGNVQSQNQNVSNNLDTIAIFHYVWGGLKLFASLFVLIYVFLGIFMIGEGVATGDSELQIMGGVFIAGSILGFVIVIAFGIMSILCGKYLKEKKNRMFCMVISALACTNAPIGTILGIFTIIEIEKPEVKQLFEKNKQKTDL